MPTASASISASMMVVELILIRPVAIMMISADWPAPNRAMIRGNSPAPSEPRVATSTMNATTTPMASTHETCGMLTLKTSPPTCTSLPGTAFCSSAAFSRKTSRWASVKVDTLPTTRMRALAATLSSLTMPFTYSL